MKIENHWVSWFVDGEGCFYVWINKHSEMSSWFQVLPEFRIVQHEKDIQLLYALKKHFWCWVVRKNHDTRYELRIRKIEHLQKVIIPFFEKYPLHTQKKFDFLSFRKILLYIERWEHLKSDGIKKILRIAKTMNRREKSITENNVKSEIG